MGRRGTGENGVDEARLADKEAGQGREGRAGGRVVGIWGLVGEGEGEGEGGGGGGGREGVSDACLSHDGVSLANPGDCLQGGSLASPHH